MSHFFVGSATFMSASYLLSSGEAPCVLHKANASLRPQSRFSSNQSIPVTAEEGSTTSAQSESGFCRDNHTYRTAPNAAIVQHIFSLASSRSSAIRMAHQVASQVLQGQVSVPLEQLRVSTRAPAQLRGLSHFSLASDLTSCLTRVWGGGEGGILRECPQKCPTAQDSCGYGPMCAFIPASATWS